MILSDDVRELNDEETIKAVEKSKPRRKKNEDKKYLFVELVDKYGKNLPKYKSEFLFHPSRKWRADFCFTRKRLIVEIDGGQWLRFGGRHSRDSDRWKLCEAAAMNYRVIHLSPEMIKSDPLACIDVVSRALGL